MKRERAVIVLVVDDDSNYRRTAKTVLEKRGFIVKTASGGFEAVDEVKRHPPDVVVLDIRMPGKNGGETLKDIRKLHPDLPVIALTGHWPGINESQFSAVLHKPCNLDILADCILKAAGTREEWKKSEPLVRNLMIPLVTFNRVRQDCTVKEAVNELFESLYRHREYMPVTELVHRAILITDNKDRIIGLLSFRTLLDYMYGYYGRMIKNRPSQLSGITISPPEFPGLFMELVQDIHDMKVRDILPPGRPFIDGGESLVSAMKMMVEGNHRRLIVTEEGVPVGMIREQNIFFEMAKIYGRKL